MNPTVYVACDDRDLELGEDPVPLMTMANCLKTIDSKKTTHNNSYPIRKRVLLSQRQVKYVEDIIVTRHMENLGISRKEMIQVIRHRNGKLLSSNRE